MYKIYSIYDEKAKTFFSPTVARTREDYKRSFKAELQRMTDSVIYTNPEDFFIYEIGSWDPSVGVICNVDEISRENLGRVSDL